MMERLTDPGYIPEKVVANMSNEQLANIYKKLCIYESTELEPNQIDAMIEKLADYENLDEQALLHKTKIYRNDCFFPKDIKLFETIEKALGFKLYFWQKTFLTIGKFRQGGFTTAECLKQLFGDTPIDYTERPKNKKEQCYRWQLLEIKKKLQIAGVETVPVLTCKKDKRDYEKFVQTTKPITVDEVHPKFAYKFKEGE